MIEGPDMRNTPAVIEDRINVGKLNDHQLYQRKVSLSRNFPIKEVNDPRTAPLTYRPRQVQHLRRV